MTDEQQIIFRTPEICGPIADIDTTQEGWSIPKGDLHHGVWIREHHDIVHDPHFTSWCADWIEAGTAVVDIGANIGTHSVPYLRRRPSWLLSVEPSPTLFECLRRNILREISQTVPSVSVMASCCAVGADFGIASFRYNSDRPGMSCITDGEGYGVELRPLHHLTEFLDGQRISFLKIDVEGYEPFVLIGAKETVLNPKNGRHRPTIVMEINGTCLARQGWNAAMLFELMSTLGYRELGKWPPEYDRLSKPELLEKPVFDVCFVP